MQTDHHSGVNDPPRVSLRALLLSDPWLRRYFHIVLMYGLLPLVLGLLYFIARRPFHWSFAGPFIGIAAVSYTPLFIVRLAHYWSLVRGKFDVTEGQIVAATPGRVWQRVRYRYVVDNETIEEGASLPLKPQVEPDASVTVVYVPARPERSVLWHRHSSSPLL